MLTCGPSGSTGQEIIEQINTNTDDIAVNATDIANLETEVTNLDLRLQSVEAPTPRATMHLVNEVSVTLTDDPTPIVLPIFDAVVTERGDFNADLANYRLINNGPDQDSVLVTMGVNVRFSGTETLELIAYVNGSAYNSAAFYLRGMGDNKPISLFWQSDIALASGDYIDLRARNASSGNVTVTFVRTQFRIDGDRV